MGSKMESAIKLMVTTDMSQKEIANQIGVEESTISRWKKRKDFKIERERQESEFFDDLKSPALKTLNKLLKAKSEFVRYSTAVYIIDKTNVASGERENLANQKIQKEIEMMNKKIEQMDRGDSTQEDKIKQLHDAITDVISND